MRNTSRKCFFITALAVLVFTGSARGSLLSENFEGGTIPAGWTHATQLGNGDWTVASPSFPSVSAHSGSYVALYNSFLAQTGSIATLVTPALNMVGYSSTTLSFWMYHDTGFPAASDRVTVYVSTGGNWDAIGLTTYRYATVNGWREETADLSGYIGNPAVQIGFFATANFGYNMFIDDVTVTAGEIPEPATMTLMALGLGAVLFLRRRA